MSRSVGPAIVVVLAAYSALSVTTLARGQDPTSAVGAVLPTQLKQNHGFASSSQCKDCHPDQYASWHRSFHRTMTQAASAENFIGRFDGTQIDSSGLKYRVFKRDGGFWAEMPNPDTMLDRQRTHEMRSRRGDPAAPPVWNDIPLVERQVVMSTGSHHYQKYWVESEAYPGTLMTLPLVYLIRDQRWIPRESAFMSPPGPPRLVTVWNDHCINCHSTGPNPRPYAQMDTANKRLLETGFHTEVGELGIACEACHGPAQKHVELRTVAANGTLTALGDAKLLNDPIVQPATLSDHRRSTYVCGQCHGVFIRNAEQAARFIDDGANYIPGDDLLAWRHYIFPPQDDERSADDESQRVAKEEFARNKQFFRERFWDNGLILAGGREFTALAMSKCYQTGTASCLSCHSMHQSDPSDQLKQGMDTGAACTQCHKEDRFTTAVATHTHHKTDSSGSDCLNCHMPRTTYALFTAIRSHQIESPDLAGSVRHGVPNACNLCHLDKSLAWTQNHLADWYAYPKYKLSVEQEQVSAALVWMLEGHAAQRAIVAWHVGWTPAQQVSGNDWLAPFLARLLADPYGVVRYIAGHSLQTLPGFDGFVYNFLAAENELKQSSEQAVNHWRQTRNGRPSRVGREVLLDRQGDVVQGAVDWLLRRRDNRPVTIKE